MRILLRGLVRTMVACAVAVPLIAATPSEFYLTMLRRGIAAHDAGRYDAAASSLRIAAFGFVESVEHYQTAQLYLALSYDRMGDADRARDAARKLVAAEKVERRYTSLSIPPATRSNFEVLARRALTAADLSVLGRAAEGVIAPQATPVAATTTNTEPEKTAPVPPPSEPEPVTQQPPAPPKPTPTTQQPSNSATQQPTTQPSNPATQQPITQPTNPPKPQPRNSATPQPTAQPTTPPTTASRFAEAERHLTTARLAEARAIYRELLERASLQRADLLRLAEGFYRSRDFALTLRTFERIGALRGGEEPYRYYIAVALYETGQYRRAKDELTAVLPYIEVTPDVERYRAKIDSAVN